MIRFAQATDLPAIRELWELCFPDESGFNPYYFEHLFSLSDTLLYLSDEGALAAMVQMLPYAMRTDTRTLPVTYIYGACTHPAFRRQHLMSQLLEASFDWDRQHGRQASILIPQEAWLFDFYRPFGYQPHFVLASETHAVQPIPSVHLCACTEQDIPACQSLYLAATADYDLAILRTEAQWSDQLALFDTLGYGSFAWKEDDVLRGYAFVWQEESGLWVQELICEPPVRQAFLSALAFASGCTHIRVSGPGADAQPLGCIKWHSQMPSMRGYMNLMLN